MIRDIAGGHWDIIPLPDWGDAKEWVKSRLEPETTALAGLLLVTALLYGFVLFSYYKAFEAQTILGF